MQDASYNITDRHHCFAQQSLPCYDITATEMQLVLLGPSGKALHLYAPDSLVDGFNLDWVEAPSEVLHAHSGADQLQHGLPLQEGCCRDVHVQRQSCLARPQGLVVPNPHLHE